MAKSATAFRTIREVADWLDVAAHVLRFWESKFNQIKPVKRAGGRRYYRPADMELVGGIKVLLHDRGLTIRGVQKMITDEGVEAVMSLSPPIDAFPGDGEVVDLDPSEVWSDDMQAEEAEGASTALQPPVSQPPVSLQPASEAPAPHEVLPETVVPEPSPEAAEPGAAAISAAAVTADPAPQPQTSTSDTSPDLAPDLAPNLAPAPEPLPLHDAAEPAPRPQTADADPEPHSAPHSAPPAAPPADTAEGPLGVLAGFSQLPLPQRARLQPQIAALTQLRDRMGRPPATH